MISPFHTASRAGRFGPTLIVVVLAASAFATSPRTFAEPPAGGARPGSTHRPGTDSVANAFAPVRLPPPASGRQRIAAKLKRIWIQETERLDRLPLPQALQYLAEQALRRDPEKEGVPFILLSNVAEAATPVPSFDLRTGQPIPAPPPTDLNEVTVSLPKLRNVRVGDLLDAIVRTADRPIRYSIEAYAVVVAARTPGTGGLQAQTIQINPNTLGEGLQGVGVLPLGVLQQGSQGGPGAQGAGSSTFALPRVDVSGGSGGRGQRGGITGVTRTNLTLNSQEVARSFFRAAGVN